MNTLRTIFISAAVLCLAGSLPGCESPEEREARVAAREAAGEIAREKEAKEKSELEAEMAAEAERKRLYLEYLDSIESSAFFMKYGIIRDKKVRERTFYYFSDLSGVLIEISFGNGEVFYAYADDTNYEVSRENRQFLLEFCQFFIGETPVPGLDSYLSKSLPSSISSMRSATAFKYNGFSIKAGKVLAGGGVLIKKSDQ